MMVALPEPLPPLPHPPMLAAADRDQAIVWHAE